MRCRLKRFVESTDMNQSEGCGGAKPLQKVNGASKLVCKLSVLVEALIRIHNGIPDAA